MTRIAFPLSLIALALGTHAAHAGTVTLSTADLNGWQTHGDVAPSSATLAMGLNLGSTPALVLGTASASQADDLALSAGALNLSGQEPLVTGGDLEARLSLPSGAWGTDAYEGSALTRALTVNAGDTLQFQWRLATRTLASDLASSPDSAWLSVAYVGGASSLSQLAQIDTTTLAANGNWLDTGWHTATLSFSQGGTVTLGWSVVDQGSYGGTSLLALQQVSVTSAVPEPQGLALALAGLAWLGTRRRAR